MDSYKKLREGNDARYREMQQIIETANQNGGDMDADTTKRFEALDQHQARTLPDIIDVGFVSQTQQEDLATTHGFALPVQGIHDFGDNILGHGGIDLTG